MLNSTEKTYMISKCFVFIHYLKIFIKCFPSITKYRNKRYILKLIGITSINTPVQII